MFSQHPRAIFWSEKNEINPNECIFILFNVWKSIKH